MGNNNGNSSISVGGINANNTTGSEWNNNNTHRTALVPQVVGAIKQNPEFK